jgi:8-amino-7-oxononanoate synthase
MVRVPRVTPGYGLQERLAGLEERGLRRRPATVHSRAGAEVCLETGAALNFCSNDYLGLAGHPRLVKAWQDGAANFGVGATASPLVCGRHAVHAELERELARQTGRERALLFPSGFQANLAVITALAAGRRDRILMDRLCHASLIDGALLSRAPFRRYAHGDAGALQKLLQAGGGDGLCLVISESVFSMDGDLAPLVEYARLCREHGACLYVDEAHAFGVLGEHGRGALEALALGQDDVPVMMATFGKALGVAGAFVAGREEVIETLVQQARPYMFSTATPPAQAAAVLEALKVMQDEGWRRDHLGALIRRFRDGASERGLTLLPSETPIQPLLLGDARRTVAASEALRRRGFFVAPIRPPTVPEGGSRLRITLSAGHTVDQVDALLQALTVVAAA